MQDYRLPRFLAESRNDEVADALLCFTLPRNDKVESLQARFLRLQIASLAFAKTKN